MAFIENSDAKEWRIGAAFGVAFLAIVAFSWIATGLKSPPRAPSDTHHTQDNQNIRPQFPDQSQALDEMTKRAQRGESIDMNELMRITADERARKRDAEEHPGGEILKGRIATNEAKLNELDQCIEQAKVRVQQTDYNADNAVRQSNMGQQQTQLESSHQLRWPGQPATDDEQGSTGELTQPSEEAVGVDLQQRDELNGLYRQRKVLIQQIGQDKLELKFRGGQ
jgi:hypothetical protein